MVACVNALLSRSVSVDRETGNLSIFEILDNLRFFSPETPSEKELVIPLEFTLVSIWKRDDDDDHQFEIFLRVKHADGYEGKEHSTELVFKEGSQNSRMIMRFTGITWRGEGDYEFNLYERKDGGETLKGSCTLRLSHVIDPKIALEEAPAR